MPKIEAGERTCFLFLSGPHPDSYHSLLLENGAVTEPLAHREKADFEQLQAQAKTYVILPATLATLYHLPLPRLSEKKAAMAIAFSLEDKLAQPLSEVHLAWQYDFASQSYTVIAIDKALLKTYLDSLEAAEIQVDVLTLDACALMLGEAIDISNVLLYTDGFHGSIPYALLPLYSDLLKDITCLAEPEAHLSSSLQIESIPCAHTWIAKRLLNMQVPNFCQGAFAKAYTLPKERKLYLILGGLVVTWLVTLFLYQGVSLYKLHRQIHAVDDKIAVIYKQFFPNAHQVISPRFRIEQLLKHGNKNTTLWLLLDKLAEASPQATYTLEKVEFKPNKLTLHLKLQDFKQLETLTAKLQQTGIHVKQTQASQQAKQIQVQLELTP